MVNIIKEELSMEEHLRKKLALICNFANIKPIVKDNLYDASNFTDWINVKNAKPLFGGHQQPKVPENDFYYDPCFCLSYKPLSSS